MPKPKPKLRKRAGSALSFNEKVLEHKLMASFGMHLDSTLGELEESRFKGKHVDLIRKLSQELRLTYNEIEAVVLIYYKFQKEAGNTHDVMTKNQFRQILHTGFDMTHSEINDIIMCVLDKSPNPNICMEAWVRAMSLFLRGTFEEKVKHCFNVYDMYGHGILLREKMISLMNNSILGQGDSEDIIRDLYDLIINKMDKDRDGKISYEDYHQAVTKEPLMMEAFGQCLPTRLAAHTFRTTFTHYAGKYY